RTPHQRTMVPAISKNKRGAGRGARSPDPLLSAALGESLRAMAGEHSRLVHQPAGLVGASDTGLVPEIPNCRGRRVGTETKRKQPTRLPPKIRTTFACRSNRPEKVGSKIPTRSILGFHRGFGLMKR